MSRGKPASVLPEEGGVTVARLGAEVRDELLEDPEHLLWDFARDVDHFIERAEQRAERGQLDIPWLFAANVRIQIEKLTRLAESLTNT